MADDRAAEDGIMAKCQPGSLEEISFRIGSRVTGIVEVWAIHHADSRVQKSLNYNFRIRRNTDADGLAVHELDAALLERAREFVFILPARVAGRSCDENGLVDTDGDRHLERFTACLGFRKLHA